ncbi:MAG: polyribonucleotide nucleotidyltransferase [Gemmatimonadota bacterium]
MIHRIEREFHGRPLIIETGRMAKQADASVYIQYGETGVLIAATAERKPTHLPFFPLTVEYREKTYAAGKFPGGFIKRETRPGEKETVSARQIDRPLRPLFPEDYRNETQVACFIVSADQENDADVIALLGASAALSISPIPWGGPVAGVRVGRMDGEWLINPTFADLEMCDLELVVVGSADAIVMVEGACLEISEDEFLEGMAAGQEAIRELIDLQNELIELVGAPTKFEYVSMGPADDIVERVEAEATEGIGDALRIADKEERGRTLSALREEVTDKLAEDFPDSHKDIGNVFRKIEKQIMRSRVLQDGVRIDGRGPDDIRGIDCDVSLLPRTHGSALFTRGETQALAVTTLGTVRDEQRMDSLDTPAETTKSFMLHYNFPGFATGEVRRFMGTSRREVGHGQLAERALQPLLPEYEDFPYTIRVVSEVLESNGSSSMASVCGGSLALMDAGVPMRAPCAGIAMGLIKEGDDVAILTDILGVEDALGDMDFKIAGTARGITAVQMDIKADGLSADTMRTALERAREARLKILEVMNETLAEARDELSEWAPRIITVKINPEKIGEIIGPKGKTIRMIQEESGASINVEDDGTVTVSAVSGEAGERAREMIEAIVEEPEVGRIYHGVVKNTTTFGAFVEIIPGVEGLCHISELEEGRTENTEDVVKPGDEVDVKLLAVDERGRMKLSRRAAMEAAAANE